MRSLAKLRRNLDKTEAKFEQKWSDLGWFDGFRQN